MKYQNIKTGLIFETVCEVKGPNFKKLESDPVTVKTVVEEKTEGKTNRRTKK